MNLQFGGVWLEYSEPRVTRGPDRPVNTVLQTPVYNAVKFGILGIVWFIAAQFGVSNGAPPSTSECHCGYGGLCFKDAVNNPFVFNCRLCREISGKFYGSDCTNINNNCIPSPCQRGVCIPTFGSYYCKCPPDYFGKNCGYHQPILTRAGLKNEVYVYYQVQPYHDGTNNFHIVVDPLNQLKIWQEYGVGILVTVEIENGKVLYPLRDKHFAFRNIKQNCLTDSKLNPDLYDVKVCDHLPEGDVWTYTVDCTSYIPSYLEPENIISVPGVGRIGRRQLLKLRIEVTDETGVQEVLFEETYITFTYSFFARIPNNCNINVRFRGCSLEKHYPSVYSLGDSISIGGISENVGCKGILDLGSEWFLQKNIERLRQYAFDRTPWKVRDRRPGTVFLSFRRRYLKPGLHLLEFVHHLRGNPPMIGGTRQFNRTTGCWIRSVANTPSFGIEGGTKRTASCYQSLRLKVMLYDKNYDLSDFTFTSSCTSTLVSDEECMNRNMEGPYLNKFFTPCNTEYNYTISATHRVSITPPTQFSIQVAFIPAETELHVQCIFNCNPIDPELLVLVGAWTIPYVPQPVTWAVTINGVPLDPRNIYTTGFQHSSRILRVDGDHFRQDGVQSVDVEFSASKGENRLYATLISMVDILDSDITKFVLTTKTEDETLPVYGFTNVSVIDYLFNNPMTYAVYSFDDSIREMIVEVETTYIPLISFTPVLKKVTFCLMDSSLTLHTRKCTKGFYAVTSWSMPQISLAQLELESRIEDTRNFLRHAQGYLIRHLGVFDNAIMRWDISREERTQILGFMTRYKLSRQSDIMASLSILSMMFYSENGCRDQELLRFDPEKDVLSNFNAATAWLKMNYEAIHVLRFTVVQIFNRLSENNLKMRDYGYGDIFDKLYSTWTLAFLQEAFIFSHSFKKENPTILDLYLSAAINFWRIKNNTKLNSVGMYILELILSFQQPFYGLRFVGKGSIQGWVTKAPYSCIRSYANKSNPEGETFPKLVEYVFSSPGRPPGDWVSYFNLILPDVIPGLEYEKLSFLVVIVKNLEGNEVEIAPTLVLDLRRENGSSIAGLPRDNGYQVTIPEMENGELSNSSTQFTKGKFMLIKEPSRSERYDHRSVSAYKLVLPAITKKFIFFVYQDKPIPLKVCKKHM